MKKYVVVLNIFFLICFACSSGDSGIGSSDTVLLTKRVTTWANSSVTFETNYGYDGNKLIKLSIDEQTYTLYSYSGNLISSVKMYNGGYLEVEVFYVYDTSERLINETIIDHVGFNGEKYTYTYNQDNTVDFNFYTGSTTAQNALSKTGIVYRNDNNDPVKVETFSQGELTNVDEFSYGNKWSCLKNAISFRKTFVRYPSASKYNVLTNQNFDGNHNLLSSSSDNANYNSMNFPESANSSNATTHFYYN